VTFRHSFRKWGLSIYAFLRLFAGKPRFSKSFDLFGFNCTLNTNYPSSSDDVHTYFFPITTQVTSFSSLAGSQQGRMESLIRIICVGWLVLSVAAIKMRFIKLSLLTSLTELYFLMQPREGEIEWIQIKGAWSPDDQTSTADPCTLRRFVPPCHCSFVIIYMTQEVILYCSILLHCIVQ
jgi:hypothetical protein